jgi:hypothetical protein
VHMPKRSIGEKSTSWTGKTRTSIRNGREEDIVDDGICRVTRKQWVHHSYGINRSQVRLIYRLCGWISLPQLGLKGKQIQAVAKS